MDEFKIYENNQPENFDLKFHTENFIDEFHRHEEIEIMYFLDDEWIMSCESKNYAGVSRDLIIVNSNQLHYTRGTKFYCLRFSPNFFPDMSFENVLFQTYIPNDKTVKSLFEKISQEERTQNEGFNMEITSAVYSLISYLLRNYKLDNLSESDVILRKNKAYKISEVIDYIALNYSKKLTTAKLAKEFHLSENYFCSLFKSQAGISPVNYLNKFRAEKAAIFLKNINLSVEEVALKVGYHDTNYFARVFKKYMNISPSGYKKEFLKSKG